jgi:hypothetical protein
VSRHITRNLGKKIGGRVKLSPAAMEETHDVDFVLWCMPLYAECKFIEAQFERSPQQVEPTGTRAFQTEAESLVALARVAKRSSSATPPFK